MTTIDRAAADPSPAEVARRIRGALAAHAEQVDVAVRGQCAVLRGTVPSWADHENAGRAAQSAPGVTQVDNQLALLVKGKIAAP